MIRTIDIRLNAAHPELPLPEATTYVGAPSAVFVRGVPKTCGNWVITAVYVSANFPDGSATTRAAVNSVDGVWVATIPGNATSGRTENGLVVSADGIDENGDPVTGYVLAVMDFSISTLLPVPAPGCVWYYFRLFDSQPSAPKKGDAYRSAGGNVLYWNGAAWVGFADGVASDLSALAENLGQNYYTKAQTDDAIDRVAAYYITYNAAGAAFPTAAALLNATMFYSGGVVRVPTRNDYAVVLADENHGGAEWQYIYAVPEGSTTGQWEAKFPIETNDYSALLNKPQINSHTLAGNQTAAQLGLATPADCTLAPANQNWIVSPQTIEGMAVSIVWNSEHEGWQVALNGDTYTGPEGDRDSLSLTFNFTPFDTAYTVTAKRHGLVLGGQTALPVASEAEAEALRQGKQAALTAQQLANIAAVPSKANASNLPYAISESMPLTVTGGAASTTLNDRTHNVRTVAAPGSGNTTTITATLPPIVAGKSRDMFLNLTVGAQASDAGDISLSIVEPSGATVQIDIGSVEDIGIGKNEILISENALPTTSGNVTTTHWLVTVRHEDFAS